MRRNWQDEFGKEKIEQPSLYRAPMPTSTEFTGAQCVVKNKWTLLVTKFTIMLSLAMNSITQR
jgi:hypothetical protein